MWGAFYNSGQSRNQLAGVLVHEDVATTFSNMLSEITDNTLELSNPRLDTTNYGCVRDQDYIQDYEDVVQDA